ncbi:MAG TPA: hypothetical protein VGS18_05125 [Thermoplasmata archaeon]|nr:hypothetical protein [Thermoplasmata archaeon]
MTAHSASTRSASKIVPRRRYPSVGGIPNQAGGADPFVGAAPDPRIVTLRSSDTEALALSFAQTITPYLPALAYPWNGLATTSREPSPNSQVQWNGAVPPDWAAEKVSAFLTTGSPTTVGRASPSVGFTSNGTEADLVATPRESVTCTVTEYRPKTVKEQAIEAPDVGQPVGIPNHSNAYPPDP